MEEFEREVRQALERRPAPPGLKRHLMERRIEEQERRRRRRVLFWEHLAAAMVLAAVLSGALLWRHVQQRRAGEAARRQVFTALRITARALDNMNAQLTEHDRDAQ